MKVARLTLTALLAALVIVAGSPGLRAHCQIPCGIYGDQRVMNELEEHVATIEKGMKQIVELSKDPKSNANQLTRWVMNKEDHAAQIQQVVLDYFLAQRVKLGEAGQASYGKKLALLHQVVVYTMKCKQTTDPKNVESLKKSLADFKALYFKK